jgi:apolipoprotein D and lipocalin family protein
MRESFRLNYMNQANKNQEEFNFGQFISNVSGLIIENLFPTEFRNTVKNVDIQKFMGKWYVVGSRPTIFEVGAHNAIELYTYDSIKEEIDIKFTYNQGSLEGPVKSVPQTGYIVDKLNNSHWKVSPFWPLKFDYLIIALEKDYQWTVIGVPDQKYIWIMARTPSVSEETYLQIIKTVEDLGYNTINIQKIKNIE